MGHTFSEYNNSSYAYKVITSPSKVIGLTVGQSYYTVMQFFGRKTMADGYRNSENFRVSELLPILGVAGAEIFMRPPTIATAAVDLAWLTASLITDASTNFKATRAGFREFAGYNVKDAGPKII